MGADYRYSRRDGFTLIEMSIVLVIVGLIIGGVLVGQDLIKAAGVRATMSQIEKYNTAVNTFRGKYGALPGDLNQQVASQFGFTSRGAYPGMGDGNGIVEGSASNAAQGFQQCGETLAFWEDLSVGNYSSSINVNLIDGSFNAFPGPANARPTITSANAASYLPPAKLGGGNSVYVYSTGGVNYFGVAPMTTVGGGSGGPNALTASLTVQQAYLIDKKVDDGFPASGNITATWDSGDGTLSGAPAENAPAPTVNAAATDSPTSCYNSTTPAGVYSLNQNNGAGANCALSFRFQ